MASEFYKIPQAPMLTDLYLQELIEAQVPKPTALGTQARYSDAASCSRAIGYAALGVEPTDPMDAPGIWVTTLGTHIHEQVQAAIGRAYPGALFETPTRIGQDISGSSDGFIPEEDLRYHDPSWEFGNVLYELKTMGAFAFDKQIGLKRRARALGDSEGPKFGAILQAGLNALGWNELNPERPVSTLILGSISMEAVSIQLAQQAGLDELGRIMAEFVIPHDIWYEPALREARRIKDAVSKVNQDFLPVPLVIDDLSGVETLISPTASRPAWQCTYCKFQSRCIRDGDVFEVPVDIRRDA